MLDNAVARSVHARTHPRDARGRFVSVPEVEPQLCHRGIRAWRIEHPKDRWGPFAMYGPGGYPRPHVRQGRPGEVSPTEMPGPGNERDRRNPGIERWAYNDDMRFAFPTAKELLKWYTGWSLRELTVKGYEVLQLAVPWDKHIRKPCQVIYDRRDARVLRRMAPVDLLWEAPGPVEYPRPFRENCYF
jgi:hypothetical protein